MDLRSSSWHLEHLREVLQIDLAELAADAPNEAESQTALRVAIPHKLKSEDLEYLVERLQAIGLSVGKC